MFRSRAIEGLVKGLKSCVRGHFIWFIFYPQFQLNRGREHFHPYQLTISSQTILLQCDKNQGIQIEGRDRKMLPLFHESQLKSGTGNIILAHWGTIVMKRVINIFPSISPGTLRVWIP